MPLFLYSYKGKLKNWEKQQQQQPNVSHPCQFHFLRQPVICDELVFIPFSFGRWKESSSACSPKSGLLSDLHSTKIHLSYANNNGTNEGWFGCTMVRCLVNFAIGPAVKLNQDPQWHKSQFGLSQEKFYVWPRLSALVYCMGWNWAFFVSQGVGKDNILYTSVAILCPSHFC